MINAYINALIQYALSKGLMEPEDCLYCTNRLISLFQLSDYSAQAPAKTGEIHELLNAVCDWAVQNGLIEDTVTARDLFDTAVMGELTPRPSYVRKKFFALYGEDKTKATDWYYAFSRSTNYIRDDRIAKNVVWQYHDPVYGLTDITINLSKPEKTTAEIEAAKKAPQASYPKCLLCKECEGFSGNVSAPARQNHRIIPIKLQGEAFYLQYSPYVYYNEHCIVFNAEHTPMVINKGAFAKLLDFVTLFPHYFLGSNADLPIVGGSILAHEHFQGGHYEFAMERAPIETEIHFKEYPDVKAGIVNWPLSTIRITSDNKESLVNLADKILTAWRGYTDEKAFILAYSKDDKGNTVPHNTITPIARRRGDAYELDLVLRNNITTPEHPQGVYHPHKELHHIKQENIGLIEVMGLAVLPARLKSEMELVKAFLVKGTSLQNTPGEKHEAWAKQIKESYPQINEENADEIIKTEIGKVFSVVLEHAGVYKRNAQGKEAFLRFVDFVC